MQAKEKRKSFLCWQVCENLCIILTPECVLLIFLQSFWEEIDKNYHKKTMEYVWNTLKITPLLNIMLEPLQM